jgi:hypothetical protein
VRYRHSSINTEQIFGLMVEYLTLHGQSETMVKLYDIVLCRICQAISSKVKSNEALLCLQSTKTVVCQYFVTNMYELVRALFQCSWDGDGGQRRRSTLKLHMNLVGDLHSTARQDAGNY